MPITGLSRHGRLRSPDFPAPAPIVQRLGAAYAALALVPFRGPYDARRPLSPVLFFLLVAGLQVAGAVSVATAWHWDWLALLLLLSKVDK